MADELKWYITYKDTIWKRIKCKIAEILRIKYNPNMRCKVCKENIVIAPEALLARCGCGTFDYSRYGRYPTYLERLHPEEGVKQ